jgi:hypothetical protein
LPTCQRWIWKYKKNLDLVSVYLIVFQFYYWNCENLIFLFSNLSNPGKHPTKAAQSDISKKIKWTMRRKAQILSMGVFQKKINFCNPYNITRLRHRLLRELPLPSGFTFALF